MTVKITKKINAEKQAAISIRTMIHQNVPAYEPARTTKHTHASELTKDVEFCPREIVLLDIAKKKPKGDFIPTSLRLTFDMGRFLQEEFNTNWLREDMLGCWKCKSCGDHREDTTFRKTHCGRSGVLCNWEYAESRFGDPESDCAGGIDAIVDVGEPLLRMVEVKTIEKDGFKELVGPQAEHRLRTNLYLRLIDLDGRPFAKRINTKVGHLLYICKGYGVKDETVKDMPGVKDFPFSPFKEFLIHRDDSETDELLAKARAVYKFRKKKGGVPYGVCSTSMVGRAKKCSMIKQCFSGQFPAKQKWK